MWLTSLGKKTNTKTGEEIPARARTDTKLWSMDAYYINREFYFPFNAGKCGGGGGGGGAFCEEPQRVRYPS